MNRRKIRITTLLAFLVLDSLSDVVNCEKQPYNLMLSTNDLDLIVNETKFINLRLSGAFNESLNIKFKVSPQPLMINIKPYGMHLKQNNTHNIQITGIHPGLTVIRAVSTPNRTWIGDDVFLRVIVANSWLIFYISFTFGWIYFVAWSVSFYPQIYTNSKRNSIIGLNIDFAVLNAVSFIFSNIFNVGLFWIPAIQQEYFKRYPRALNPILVNDIFFSLHATFASTFIVFQCFVYKCAVQKLSYIASGILGVFFLFTVITTSLSARNIIDWLDFICYCRYIELASTSIKYIPQTLLNYERKSTIGFSIGFVLFDFVGNIMYTLQMILDAYNYGDLVSMIKIPKFDLKILSVGFDILFMLQHYVFYRNKSNQSKLSKEIA